jgi:hypothetical protein
MQASKALVILVVVGVIVAFGVFLFAPNLRPAFVDKWFKTAQGITPAKTPREALEKFHERIKARDYKNAALYVGGPYAEEMKISGDAGTELANAVDNVLTAMDNKNLNSPQAKLVLALLQPFPKDMKIQDVKHKEGEDKATAQLEFDIGGVSLSEARFKENWNVDPRIFLALFPKPAWTGLAELKLEGDGKDKGWRIQLPLTPPVRESASYLKANYGNYVSALNGFSRDIKNNPYTVDNLVNELKKALEESKPK